MVIQDWAKSPIFAILQRGKDELKAILMYCNKATLNRLAGDLRERKEYEERTELKNRRERTANKQKNPFFAADSDSSQEDEN